MRGTGKPAPRNLSPCAGVAILPIAQARAAVTHNDQNRVRMPTVPTTWFAVEDAPPAVLMNAT